MTTPQTPPADAVARLTKLADDYASRGDFATEDDIRTLLAAYADAARDRERMREVMNTAARSLNDLSDTDGAYLGGWGGLMNTLSHRLTDAARTGEAR